jgi:cytochrome oxidase assembly protein ShyY1
MMVLFPHYYLAVKWIGLAFMLVAVLWSSAFRQRLVD